MSEGAAVSKRSTKIAFSVGHAQDDTIPEGHTRLVVADLDPRATPRPCGASASSSRATGRAAASRPRTSSTTTASSPTAATSPRAASSAWTIDLATGERVEPVGRDRLLQRGRRHLPRRPVRLRRERPPVAGLRRPGQLPQHRRLEAPARRDRPRLHPPHDLQRPRGLEGLQPGRLHATAASWPSRSRAPPTRPASATASCCCTSTAGDRGRRLGLPLRREDARRLESVGGPRIVPCRRRRHRLRRPALAPLLRGRRRQGRLRELRGPARGQGPRRRQLRLLLPHRLPGEGLAVAGLRGPGQQLAESSTATTSSSR